MNITAACLHLFEHWLDDDFESASLAVVVSATARRCLSTDIRTMDYAAPTKTTLGWFESDTSRKPALGQSKTVSRPAV
jgi:hypothetical protein